MNTRKEWKFFTIFEHEKEQDYLRDMHRSGWKFQRLTGLGCYHFSACAPEDVVYQLDYNREGLAHKDEYVQMFRDCGWEYLQDYMGYAYFRKPAAQTNGPEEIFCDDDSRRQMLERVFKGRILPLAALFSALLVPQFVTNLAAGRLPLVVFYGLLVGVYLGVFGMFAVKYWQFRDKK